jgi:hypothetical protein
MSTGALTQQGADAQDTFGTTGAMGNMQASSSGAPARAPLPRVENRGFGSSAAGAYYSAVFIDIPLHIFLASLTERHETAGSTFSILLTDMSRSRWDSPVNEFIANSA